MKRPNILYLHCHDAGRYIEPFGCGVRTPHLMNLARHGMLFRNNYCAAPTCSASRAALLTGTAPHSNGMFGLAHIGWKLNDYKQHIIHTLHDAGYYSALCGVQHVANFNKGDAADIIGYKERIQPVEVKTEHNHREGHDRGVAAGASQWLKDRKSDEPFFLAVGFVFPHRVYLKADPENHPEEDSRYMQPPRPLPDTPEVRQDIADFAASVRVMDECAGQVLDALETFGFADNTLVIATTDHGIAFPYMKANLTEHGSGTYLMLKGPGIPEGRVIDALTSHIDVFPTVCDILGIDHPDWLQGQSLLPLIKGETDEVNEQVYVENTFHAAYEPMRGIRTKRYKYILKYDEEWKQTVQPNCDDGLSKKVWQDHGWGKHEQPFT
jgi:arylsulfatase A-like enzyme